MHNLKPKLYLKSRSIVYFFKYILNKASLVFAFTIFVADSLHIKNRFHYVKCFSQVTAKHTKNRFQIKKNVMCKDHKVKIKSIFLI